MMARPNFLDSPYFTMVDVDEEAEDAGDNGWRLKPGAPPDVVAEFEEFQRTMKEAYDRGIGL